MSVIYCNWSILFGQGNAVEMLRKETPSLTGVRYNERNKHQLLHRIASIWITQIYNTQTPSKKRPWFESKSQILMPIQMLLENRDHTKVGQC